MINRRELLKRMSLSLGGIASASTIAAIVSGCDKALETAQENPNNEWTPAFFSKHQAQTVSLLAELFIPRTDTPGALDVGVPQFIEGLVQHVFQAEERENFEAGLFSLDLISKGLFESNFADSRPEEQYKLSKKMNFFISEKGLDGKEEKIRKYEAKIKALKNIQEDTLQTAKNYFTTIKELTILGFFTSEIGATQVLQYNPIPGSYKGCVPYDEIGKTWATPR